MYLLLNRQQEGKSLIEGRWIRKNREHKKYREHSARGQDRWSR